MALTPKQNSTAEPGEKKKRTSSKQSKAQQLAALRSNVTDQTIDECYQASLKAKLEHEEAMKSAAGKNSLFRATLKDAKKKGVDPDDITWRLKQRFRDPKEIDAEPARRSRIARLTNLPLGTQLGLEFGQSVATSIENGKAAEQQENDDWDAAHQRGVDDGKAGKQAKSPYDPETQAELHHQYEVGHRTGTGANVLGLGKKNGASGAAAH